MSRPMKKRRVSALPPCTRFMPQEGEDAPEVTISLEEYECIRLLDYIGMTQEECARQIQGSADEAVNAFLAGNLAYDLAVHCDHHGHGHGEGHSCGGHGHGCGGHGHGHGCH